MTDDGHQGSGGEDATTNQRMELTAVLRALEALAEGPVAVHSDSTYVVNCFRDRWYEGWLARGWKNTQRKPVANRDLWEPLVALVVARGPEVSFTWVKGHAGNPMNELADQLAVEALNRHRDGSAALALAGLSDDDLGESGDSPRIEAPWPVERAIVVGGSRTLDDDQTAELADTIAGLDGDNDVVVSGLRLGAELAGAELAARAGIPLAVVLPFPDPAAAWPPADRARFDDALARATWTVTLDGDRAHPGPAVRTRNRWLWEAAVGAVVVGDEALADEAEQAGLGVIVI